MPAWAEGRNTVANTIKLREQRATEARQMRDLIDLAEREDRDLTAEERQTYDRLETSVDSIGDRVERIEKNEALDAKLSKTFDMLPGDAAPHAESGDDEAYSETFNEFMRFGMADMGTEGRQLMAARRQEVKNAAAVGTGSAGGFTVPPAFRAVMVETMKAFGTMLTESEFISTESGATMPWPGNDDTGNIGEQLGENSPATAQDLAFTQSQLDAYMFSSKIVLASLQFLQDSTVSEQWLARKLGERIGRILSSKFTVGAGTTTPDGIMVSATIGVTGSGSIATTKGIAYDDLIDLQESLDPAYGNSPNAKFMMHQSVRKAIRKLKDTTGLPIWQPSVQVGAPDMLLGRPAIVNNDMATLAQNSLSLGYGDIRTAYVTRNVTGSAILLRLAERYAENAQVGFIAFDRWDGTLQDANAFKAFKTTPTA